jgi:hypothetical protein
MNALEQYKTIGSFLLIVPDPQTGGYDLLASHLVETVTSEETVNKTFSQTSIKMGLQGLLALKVQLESAILLSMGEDWVRNLQMMVESTDHPPTMAETWDLLQALEIARARYALTPEEMAVDATACSIVIPVIATEVQG